MRVLVAEDDRLTRRLLERQLTGMDFAPQLAADGLIAWEMFQEQPTELVLTDWQMPNMDGTELVRNVRDHPFGQYVYIIMLTAKQDTDEIVQGFAVGVDDYVRKPFVAEELAARLQAGRRISDLQNRLREANGYLEQQSKVDALTGLDNRRSFDGFCASRRQEGPENKGRYAVVMADIDHFKKVNDTYGHASGDEVLIEVANRLRTAFRKTDSLFRLGGEEFLIVIPGVDATQALELSERARQTIAASPFLLPDGTEVPVTCSFGAAISAEDERRDVASFAELADQALYRSKESGRNRVTVADGTYVI